MLEPNQQQPTVADLLEIINELSTQQQDILRRHLDKSWNDRCETVMARMRERSEAVPLISETQIQEQIWAVRSRKYQDN